MNTYTVLSPVKYQGRRHMPGQSLTMPAADAESLVVTGVLAPVAGTKPEKSEKPEKPEGVAAAEEPAATPAAKKAASKTTRKAK